MRIGRTGRFLINSLQDFVVSFHGVLIGRPQVRVNLAGFGGHGILQYRYFDIGGCSDRPGNF